MIIDKEKQKEDIVQDKEVFLYKPYAISLKPSKQKTPEPIFIQKVDNLKKAVRTLQLLTKIIPFLPPPHYKTIWQNKEKNIQYWKEIVVEFIKQKHNSMLWQLLVKMTNRLLK